MTAYAEPNPADAAFEAILLEPPSPPFREYANEIARALARGGWNPRARPRLEIRMDPRMGTVHFQLEYCGFRSHSRWSLRVIRAEILTALMRDVVEPFLSHKPVDHPKAGPVVIRDLEPIFWRRDIGGAPKGEKLWAVSRGTVYRAEWDGDGDGWCFEGAYGPIDPSEITAWAYPPKGPQP